MTPDVGSPVELTRAAIRDRLAVKSRGLPRGDVATANRLRGGGVLQSTESGRFGPLPSTAIPDDSVPRIPAAVLVPLVEHAHGFGVLLTQRTADLKAHAGQISFPGGRIEPGDADAIAGALRETEEEIGLARRHVEILGRLDSYLTVTGYEVTPIVEVPLTFFLDPANHQRHSRVIGEGLTRAYYAMPYGERYVWGATAGMLLNLYEVLTAAA